MGIKLINKSPLADYSNAGLGNSNPLIEFFNKVGATDDEKAAYNDFRNTLINMGVWDKLICLYPFHGSTATTQKYNITGDGYHLSFINDKSTFHTVAGYVVPASQTGVLNGRAEFSYPLLVSDTANFALGMYNSTSFEAVRFYQMGSYGTGETNVSRAIGTPITAAHANGTWVTATPAYERTKTGLLSVCIAGSIGYLMDNDTIVAQTAGIAPASSNQNKFFIMGNGDALSGGGTISFAYLMGKGATTDDVKALSDAINILLPKLGR